MKKTISFGKIAYDGTRKINEVTIELQLKETPKGYVFTACGNVWNSRHTDIICGGQCLDKLGLYIKTPLFKSILKFWRLYHLNDMNAGTVKQSEALRNFHGEYSAQCTYLEEQGLLIDNGYKYGSAWLFREIPHDDLEAIKALFT